MTGWGVLAGLLAAAGVAALVVGWWPAPIPLSVRVAVTLHGRPVPVRGGWRGWLDRLASFDRRRATDLEVAGVTAEQVTIRRALWAAGGAAASTLFWPGLAGFGTPLGLRGVLAGTGAGVGWWLAGHEVRATATDRRRQMRLALAAWLHLSAMLVRAGSDEEQAQRTAAAAGSGWAFDLLHRTLEAAVQQDESLPSALDELGATVGMVELRALAAELRITERQGASPAALLAARAAELRDQELATQLADSQRAHKRMAGPMVGLAVTVIAFMLVPALATFLERPS